MLRRFSAGTKRKRKGKATVAKQEDEGYVNHERKEDQGDPSAHERIPPLPPNPKINGKAIFIFENTALSKGFVKKEMGDEVERRKEDDKVRVLSGDDDTEKYNGYSLGSGIPLGPSNQNLKPPRVTFVLEKASLVPTYVGRSYQILNPDEHADFLRKKNMNPYDYRPDIIHEALLQIMGSRLACLVGYKRHISKLFKGFSLRLSHMCIFQKPWGHFLPCCVSFYLLNVQLLQKLSIKARGKDEKLLRLVEKPVTKHLPLNSHILVLSFSSKKVVLVRDYIGNFSNDQSLVFVVGAMAHGKMDCDYINDFVSEKLKPVLNKRERLSFFPGLV